MIQLPHADIVLKTINGRQRDITISISTCDRLLFVCINGNRTKYYIITLAYIVISCRLEELMYTNGKCLTRRNSQKH
jgi:hypothetical protein